MQSSFSAQPPGDGNRVIRRRNRVPVSCGPCRTRKLKCNRQTPCENCLKRGDASSCLYAERRASARRRITGHGSMSAADPSNLTPSDMQNRIDRLESLVLSLLTNGSPSQQAAAGAATHASGSISAGSERTVVSNESAASPRESASMAGENYESDTEQVTKSLGVMKVAPESTNSYYFNDSHWVSVLKDLSDVRQFLHKNEKLLREQSTQRMEKDDEVWNANTDQLDLMLGASPKLNEADIRAQFPPRQYADVMVDWFLAGATPLTVVFHVPTFRREYERHWQDPSKTNIVWLGMVFAMFRRVFLSWKLEGNAPPECRGKELIKARHYRDLMSQCLLLADYTKPHRYLIETLLTVYHGDVSQRGDTYLWTLSGLATRLAMRMGYHRDGKAYPAITPFHAEMRRRVWCLVRQSDTWYSLKTGMPTMIRASVVDTELPRNLYDEDFDEDCKELPPGRSLDEQTPLSYVLTKSRLMFAFARILEHVQKIKGSSYEKVMELDAELREAREMTPDHLRVENITAYTRPELVTASTGLVSTFHKGLCVLHRRFLVPAWENPRYQFSRRTCIESSLELLRLQAMLHKRLHPNQLGILNHFWDDHLMAASLLAIDLMQGQRLRKQRYGEQNTKTGQPPRYVMTGEERESTMVTALRDAYLGWYQEKDKSTNAWRSVMILGVLLEKLRLGWMLGNKHIFKGQTDETSESSGMPEMTSCPLIIADNMLNNAPAKAPTSAPEPANSNVVGSAPACQPPPLPVQPQPDMQHLATQQYREPQDEKQKAAMTLGLLSTGFSPMQVPAAVDASGLNQVQPQAVPTEGEKAFFPQSAAPAPAQAQAQPVGMKDADTGMTFDSGWLAADSTSSMLSNPASAPHPMVMLDQLPDIQQLYDPDWDVWDNYLQNLMASGQGAPEPDDVAAADGSGGGDGERQPQQPNVPLAMPTYAQPYNGGTSL